MLFGIKPAWISVAKANQVQQVKKKKHVPILKYVICFLNDAITKNIRIIVDICKETVTPLRNDHILRLKKRRKAELRLRRTFIELLLYMVFLAMLDIFKIYT
jgi:hypothetical protein